MTTPESPSLLLQRAADKLTELAEAATSGRWYATKHEYGAEVYSTVGGMSEAVAADRNAGGVGWDDADWIVAMSPAVATPLVAWLRGESKEAQVYRRQDWSAVEAWSSMRFARLVLGLSVEEETTHE